MAEKEYFLYIEGKKVEVTEEVYREYYRGERRERYFMEDLKHGRTVTDLETKENRYVPGREDSLERLMESGVQFAETGEGMEEQMVTSLLLECAMELLTPVERELVEEPNFLESTEREAGKRLGLVKTTLRRREVLDKLRNIWGGVRKIFELIFQIFQKRGPKQCCQRVISKGVMALIWESCENDGMYGLWAWHGRLSQPLSPACGMLPSGPDCKR